MMMVKIPLKTNGRMIFLAKDYLGSNRAELWIGPHEEGRTDDDDARVLRDREEAERAFKTGETRRPSGISAVELSDHDNDGYYELDTTTWPDGFYRFNYHGIANEVTPFGTALNPTLRDLQFSWANFPDDVIDAPDVEPWIWWERNGRGFCFRVQIKAGSLLPAGQKKA